METDNDSDILIKFRLASERVETVPQNFQPGAIYTPGQIVCRETDLLRGHGTYMENNETKASLAGVVERVNKFILVRPMKSRYVGQVGDVVVGRITELQQKRWKVDVNARVDALLLLSSVNLPGGELRRRSVEDERLMRKYLSEGDLISAEVHEDLREDGSLSLHTRNLKYGKLSQGLLVTVPPSLIKRTKIHFHTICGASMILGTNGYIWLYPTPTSVEDGAGGFARNLGQKVSKSEREAITRISCCIKALIEHNVHIFNTSIVSAVDYSSSKYLLHELITPEAKLDIALSTRYKLANSEFE